MNDKPENEPLFRNEQLFKQIAENTPAPRATLIQLPNGDWILPSRVTSVTVEKTSFRVFVISIDRSSVIQAANIDDANMIRDNIAKHINRKLK